MAKGVSEDQWPAFSSRSSLSAGAGLFLAIGVLCGLYVGANDKKPSDPNPKPDAQLQSLPATQQSPPTQPLSKPSPIVPAITPRAQGLVVPKKVPDTIPNLAASPAPGYATVRYEATHKKVFGGCTGQLELTRARLHFRCPNQADLNFPVASIAKTHKDGIVLKSGEKYHFMIANHSKDQVEAIFISWLNMVQQFPQPSRTAF
jgi:hypothetical protein